MKSLLRVKGLKDIKFNLSKVQCSISLFTQKSFPPQGFFRDLNKLLPTYDKAIPKREFTWCCSLAAAFGQNLF